MIATRTAPRRQRLREVGGSVAVLVACAAIGLLLSMVTLGIQLEYLTDSTPAQDAALVGLVALDLLCGLGAVALVPVLRSRLPLWAALLVAAATVFSVLAVPTALVTLIWVAARRRTRDLAVVAGTVVVAAVVGERLNSAALGAAPTPLWQLTLMALVVVAVPSAIGLARGRREAAAAALAREAAAAQRERAALLRQRDAERGEHTARLVQAREAERTRIAREMHDSLAHQLSVIAVHAGVLEYRTDLDPTATRQAAATVGAAARDAATELRQVLGVLRAGEGGAQPLPDLQRLPELITSEVRLELIAPLEASSLAGVPGPVSRHAYRIVQEALTNARKHGAGGEVRVTIAAGPEVGVRLDIRNGRRHDSPTVPARNDRAAVPASDDPAETSARDDASVAGLGAGLGVAGMAERARLVGGWCRAEDDGDDFVVRAWLPW